ncbi:unnamed protein product [marine sediment metagenome]|uniref:Uncharacterized protein n=1 Tax=marine sediment metagenome TaxID=412755 RepID=X1BW50_9ZZZZ
MPKNLANEIVVPDLEGWWADAGTSFESLFRAGQLVRKELTNDKSSD